MIRQSLFFLFLFVLTTTARSESLPRSLPEEEGISSRSLAEFVDALDQRIEGIHSMMVVRHGTVVAEGWWKPYEAGRNHVLYSLSKSFTSTAVGLVIAEGKLSISDEVLKFFPDDAPANPSSNLKAMRVQDLLMMSTGQQDEPSAAADVVSANTFLAQPVPHLPGTHFKYNTAATFMQSAIVQKVTGQTVLDYLKPRLFEPLGIEHPVWDANFQGISLGGYGLRVRTEDIAKFGLLYLQHGKWNDKQLIPSNWVAMATSKQTSNGSNPDSDWNQGYGFQFWRCRHDAFRGDGAFGQFCVVMPEQETVVAITSGTKDLQGVLNVIWDKLVPGLHNALVPGSRTGLKQLVEKLGQLQVPCAKGEAKSPVALKVSNHKYTFSANDLKIESVELAFSDPGPELAIDIRVAGKGFKVPCGYQQWKQGSMVLLGGGRPGQFAEEPCAGSFAWSAEDTCSAKICAVETPFHMLITFKFEGDKLRLTPETNVAFGATRLTEIMSNP